MTDRTCSIDGCENKRRARGLCSGHYKAERRAADPTYNRYSVTCVSCGAPFWSARKGGKLCSDACRSVAMNAGKVVVTRPVKRLSRLPMDHPVRARMREVGQAQSAAAARGMKSSLRIAVEQGQPRMILEEIRKRSTVDGDGCWAWQGRLRDGYPEVRIAKRTYAVHRLALESSLGKPLGKQAAHHICANPACVNPQHLQPVTARENTAEMLARTYMESRISDLEAALRDLDPDHPLLHEVGVITAA